MSRIKTIAVPEKVLALCAVKGDRAADLDVEQMRSLMLWCEHQGEDLWMGLTLQEVLNVYRVSAEWDTWQGWLEDEPKEALAGWNRAVRPANRRVFC